MSIKKVQNVVMLIIISLIPTLSSKENRISTLADNILNRMDPSVDPCEDFYSYACTGWINNSGKKWRFLQQLNEENQMVIRRVLEQPAIILKSLTEQKARAFYESCMDLKTITKLNEKPMLGVIRKLGEWKKKWSFQEIVQKVSNRYSVGAFFHYRVATDSRNSSKYILEIRRSVQSLMDDNYLTGSTSSGILNIYVDQMTHAGILLGSEPISTTKRVENVLKLERQIGNLRSYSFSTFLTLRKLNNKVEFIDWVAFFKNAQRAFKWKFDMQQEIEVHDLEYFKELSQLIEGYLKTDEGKIVLNDYVIWRTVFYLAYAMPKSFMEVPSISKAFQKPRWKKCIEETQTIFGFATSKIYLKEAFFWRSYSKKHAKEVFRSIRSAFITHIRGLDWMSETAKRASINKLNATSFTIGYPDIFENARADNVYKHLLIRKDTYFQNIVKIKRYFKEQELQQKINELVIGNLETVNAYYDPAKNHIGISAGILRNPLYAPNMPLSLNYGGIGVIMGHELAHVLSNKGRRYIVQNDHLKLLWDFKTEEQFDNRTKCFPDQYGDGVEDVINESLADNGGIKSAFRAYLELSKANPEAEMLPKIPLNHRQLFFLAFAQTWCSSQDEISEVMASSAYPPGKTRVNGVLSNNQHFAEEFGCKVGTKMNPPTKCELW